MQHGYEAISDFYQILLRIRICAISLASDTFDERNTNRLSSNLESSHLVKKIRFHQAKEVLKTIMQHSKNAL